MAAVGDIAAYSQLHGDAAGSGERSGVMQTPEAAIGWPEYGHGITGELHDIALVCACDVDQLAEIVVQYPGQRLGATVALAGEDFRQRGEARDVSEQYRAVHAFKRWSIGSTCGLQAVQDEGGNVLAVLREQRCVTRMRCAVRRVSLLCRQFHGKFPMAFVLQRGCPWHLLVRRPWLISS